MVIIDKPDEGSQLCFRLGFRCLLYGFDFVFSLVDSFGTDLDPTEDYFVLAEGALFIVGFEAKILEPF